MRREELKYSIESILRDIDEANIDQIFQDIRSIIQRGSSGDSTVNTTTVLIAYGNFIELSRRYSKNQLKIMKLLEIDFLLRPEFWEVALIFAESASSSDSKEARLSIKRQNVEVLFDATSSIEFTKKHLPKIIELLEQKYRNDIIQKNKSLPDNLKNKEILTVVLPEDDRHFSSPERITIIMDSISKLYLSMSKLKGIKADDLSIISCDSGSDKSFDFLGVGKVISEVRLLIMDIWDRRVANKSKSSSEFVDIISKSLPVLGEINNQKKNGSLKPEEAEILKRNILDGVSKFIEAGATIPEMEMATMPAPRQLMKPEPKLITGPPEISTKKRDPKPQTRNKKVRGTSRRKASSH